MFILGHVHFHATFAVLMHYSNSLPEGVTSAARQKKISQSSFPIDPLATKTMRLLCKMNLVNKFSKLVSQRYIKCHLQSALNLFVCFEPILRRIVQFKISAMLRPILFFVASYSQTIE